MENKNKSFLSFAIALIALALGGASLFVSINTVQKQKDSQVILEENINKALASSIESKNASAEINVLKKEIAALKDTVRQNYDSSNKNIKSALEYYSKLISENRELIVANQGAIKELDKREAVITQAPAPAPVVEASAPSVASEEESQYIIYTIKSGDYFSKLAKTFNVSIEAIEEANPNVSSTALRIGQKIKIPKAQ